MVLINGLPRSLNDERGVRVLPTEDVLAELGGDLFQVYDLEAVHPLVAGDVAFGLRYVICDGEVCQPRPGAGDSLSTPGVSPGAGDQLWQDIGQARHHLGSS